MGSQHQEATNYPGIVRQHGRSCKGGRCACGYLARAIVDGRRVAKTYPSLAAAKGWKLSVERVASGWRAEPEIRAITAANDPARTPLLLDAWAEWKDGAERGQIVTRSRHEYAGSTIACYDQAMRLNVLPVLGGRRLHAIEYGDVDALRLAMIDAGTAASTIYNAWNALSVVYREAMRVPTIRDLIGRSPLEGIREVTPLAPAREGVALDGEQAARVVGAMGSWSWLPASDGRRSSIDPRPQLGAFWALVMYAGLRRSEALGLDWASVDLEAGVLRVVKSKSSAGVRSVPIGTELRAALLRARNAGAGSGAVVGIRRAKSVYSWSAAALEEAGLPAILPHDGRKTFGSGLAADGVDEHTLTRVIGHTDIRVTQRHYIRPLPGADDRLLESINRSQRH